MKPPPRFVLAAVLSVVWAASAPGGEPYAERFQKAKASGDSKAVQASLDDWKKAQPDDPEFYIAAANYVLGTGTGVTISTKPADQGDVVVADPKTKQAVGSIGFTAPSPKAYGQASTLLKQALEKSPSRMDIYLGLATLYENTGDSKALVDDLSKMAAYVKAHPGAILGREGRPYPEPQDELLAHQINDFADHAYERDTPESHQTFHDLAKLDADAFPACVYGHNLMGIYYSTIEDKPTLALACYERALKLAPTDSLVWMNVGYLHARGGAKKSAGEAFNKVVALDNDPDCVGQAKAELAKLK